MVHFMGEETIFVFAAIVIYKKVLTASFRILMVLVKFLRVIQMDLVEFLAKKTLKPRKLKFIKY